MPAGKAKECRCFQSPSRYMQGPGLIKRLPKFAANFGKTALLFRKGKASIKYDTGIKDIVIAETSD